MVSEIAYTGADSVEDEQGAITQTAILAKSTSSSRASRSSGYRNWRMEETPFGLSLFAMS